MERLEFDLLFRWFVGLGIDDPAWDHSTFSKNRDRLLECDLAGRLLNAIMAQRRMKLLSTEHFSVDGSRGARTRIEEAFGWMKTVTGMRRPMLRGVDRLG